MPVRPGNKSLTIVRTTVILFIFSMLFLVSLACQARGQVEFEDDEEDTVSMEAVDREELGDLQLHPLDLNIATLDELLKLPLIDGRLAKAIISYREKRRFKDVRELGEAAGLTDEIYERIVPYVKVEPVKLSPSLKGDFRWRMEVAKPDSEDYLNAPSKFQNPPYLYNRTRLRYGSNLEAGCIFRHGGAQADSGSEPAINFSNLWKYYLTKYWVAIRNFLSLEKIVIGDYKLQYDQGLIFYYPLGTELARPIKIEAKGISEDRGTAPNIYFRGLAVRKRIEHFDIDFFYSSKRLDAALNPDGTLKDSLIAIRENIGYITSDDDLERKDKLTEQLVGGRVAYNFFTESRLGIMGYESRYSPEVNPSEEKGYYIFRGKRNRIFGFDFDTWYNELNLCAEYAKCIGYGDAWLIQPMIRLGGITLWTTFYDYGPDYYNEHSSATTIVGRRDESWNENGVFLGGKYHDRKREVQTYFRPVCHPWRENDLMPTRDREFWFNIRQRVSGKIELYFRHWNYWCEGKTAGEDTYDGWKKTRVEITWNPEGRAKLRVRWDGRKNIVYEPKLLREGYLTFGDLKYDVTPKLKVEGRLIFFEGEEGVALSEVEFLWPMSLTPFYWWTYGRGVRYYLILAQEIGGNMNLWIKYENTNYYDDYGIDKPEDEEELDKIIRSTRHVFRLQWELKW